MEALLLLYLLAPAHAACPDLNEALQAAESAVEEYRLEDAPPLLDQVEQALKCSWATPEQVARLWAAQAIVSDDPEEVTALYTAARRASHQTFNTNYGSKARTAWEAATSDAGMAPVELSVELPPSWETRLDGSTEPKPWSLQEGVHLVQLGPRSAPVFGRIVEVLAETPLMLELPQNTVPPASVAATPKPAPTLKQKRKKPPFLLIGSGAAMVGGAALLGLAFNEQQSTIPKAPDRERLDAARSRQLGFGYTGYGLVGLGVVGGALHFVL